MRARPDGPRWLRLLHHGLRRRRRPLRGRVQGAARWDRHHRPERPVQRPRGPEQLLAEAVSLDRSRSGCLALGYEPRNAPFFAFEELTWNWATNTRNVWDHWLRPGARQAKRAANGPPRSRHVVRRRRGAWVLGRGTADLSEEAESGPVALPVVLGRLSLVRCWLAFSETFRSLPARH